jgi:enoyl-CoA hydratase/carnithine racemase
MTIQTARHNGVAIIEIARPEKKNALTAEMYQAMADAISAARVDDEVYALLITGSDTIFTAGNDLEDFMRGPRGGENAPVFQFMKALSACEKPVVAAVTGAAIGIGVTLLLHCDLVYLADDARLVMPFVNLGLVPEFASSLLVPRLMGYAKAAEKLLLCEPITPEEAVAWGIANATLPAAQVRAHALRVAERFRELPTQAVRESKRLLRAPLAAKVAEVIDEERKVFVERLQSPEAKQAFSRFFATRSPKS